MEGIGRIGRRDTCHHCGADLHCCLNCTFYDPSFHNACRETQAERQVDKEIGNFCEFFSFGRSAGSDMPRSQQDAARESLAALFRKRP